MLLTKPASELTYEDIEALTSLGEPESITLDYKKMMSGQGPDKHKMSLTATLPDAIV
jgi:hypothetical protein